MFNKLTLDAWSTPALKLVPGMFQLEGAVTVHKPHFISKDKNTSRKVLSGISTSNLELTPSDAENSPKETGARARPSGVSRQRPGGSQTPGPPDVSGWSPASTSPAPGGQPGPRAPPGWVVVAAGGLPASERLRRSVGPSDRGGVAGAFPLIPPTRAEAGRVTAAGLARPRAPGAGAVPRAPLLGVFAQPLGEPRGAAVEEHGGQGAARKSPAAPRSRAPAPPFRARQRLHHRSYVNATASGAGPHWECGRVSVLYGARPPRPSPALPCPAAALESAPLRPGPQKAAGREGRPCREGPHGVQAGVSTCWGLPASWVSLGRRACTETHLLESDDPENGVDSKRGGLLILKRCLHLMGFSIGVTEKLVFSKFPPILFHQILAVTQRRDSASSAGAISL